MALRLKLLAPTLLAACLAVAGIAGMSVLDRRLSVTAERERDTRVRAAIAEAVQSRQQQTSNAADLLARNWRFIDDVAVAQLDHITDALTPLHNELGITYLAVYDPQGKVMVRGDRPDLFGRSDDLLPLVREVIAGHAPDTCLARRDGRVLVLALRQLKSVETVLGVLAVGIELDQNFADSFSADFGVHLVVGAKDVQVLASRGWRSEWANSDEWRPDALPVRYLLDTDLIITCWRNTTLDTQSRRQHLELIAALALASAALIWVSHRMIATTVTSLDRARRAAEAAEKRVAEIEARRNEAFLQGMIADSPISYLVVDQQAGTVLYANRRFIELWGLSLRPEDLREKMPVTELVRQCAARTADPERWTADMAALASPSERAVVDDEVGFADGRIAHRFSAQIRDADDGYLGRVFLFEDITARKRYEGDLIAAKEGAEAANRAKSEFLSVMSHELRTPLNGVIGLGHVLADSQLDDHQRECVDTIVGCGRHLLTVINDILDFSKIEAGKMEVEQIPFDPRAVIADTQAVIAELARAKNLGMVVVLDPTLPARIAGDPQRMRQILLNLLSNAVKFTELGTVTLTVTVQGERLLVAVNDTGIGITVDAQRQLFAAFIQADSSTSRRFGGTGLGLVISRRLAELLGGTITLISRAGVGSTFTLDLPLRPVAADAVVIRRESSSSARAGQAFAGLTLLVVEDDPVNRLVAKRLLGVLGCIVELVDNGDEALARLDRHLAGERLDGVLLDMQMPGMDGPACARQWRAREELAEMPRVPLIALTAATRDEDRAICREAGMDGFIAKPLDPAALVSELRRCLPLRGSV